MLLVILALILMSAVRAQQEALNIKMTGLGAAYVHNLILDGPYAYITDTNSYIN